MAPNPRLLRLDTNSKGSGDTAEIDAPGQTAEHVKRPLPVRLQTLPLIHRDGSVPVGVAIGARLLARGPRELDVDGP